MNYEYPVEPHWNKDEIIKVIDFFTQVEKAYESNVERKKILMTYKDFKQIVPSKSEEKRYFKEFEKQSGYSSYHVVKCARDTNNVTIKMI